MRRARGYAPLEVTPDGAALVERILHHARLAGPGHVAVLDLDGCLFDTRPRQVRIFRELAATSQLDRLFRVEAEHFVDWSLRTTMQNAGIDEAWIRDHYPTVRRWWEDRFFTSEYLAYDHPMPGAAPLVRAIHGAGVHVVYLTGRDVAMRPGTELSLRTFGFPLGDGATLVVKPRADMEDTAFKEAAIETIAELGTVVLYLDNEPSNVNVFRRRHPEALVVFVETDHSARPVEPDPEIPWIRSFLTRPL